LESIYQLTVLGEYIIFFWDKYPPLYRYSIYLYWDQNLIQFRSFSFGRDYLNSTSVLLQILIEAFVVAPPGRADVAGCFVALTGAVSRA
jgi:hypothetical protein